MLILYVILFILLLFWYWWKNFASAPCKNFPPGPTGLPLLGYLPIVTEDNVLKVSKFQKEIFVVFKFKENSKFSLMSTLASKCGFNLKNKEHFILLKIP